MSDPKTPCHSLSLLGVHIYQRRLYGVGITMGIVTRYLVTKQLLKWVLLVIFYGILHMANHGQCTNCTNAGASDDFTWIQAVLVPQLCLKHKLVIDDFIYNIIIITYNIIRYIIIYSAFSLVGWPKYISILVQLGSPCYRRYGMLVFSI